MSGRRRSHALDHLPAGGITLRCGCGIHHACSGCDCRCHDPQPELPGTEADR